MSNEYEAFITASSSVENFGPDHLYRFITDALKSNPEWIDFLDGYGDNYEGITLRLQLTATTWGDQTEDAA